LRLRRLKNAAFGQAAVKKTDRAHKCVSS
jgi:hypothetical protein